MAPRESIEEHLRKEKLLANKLVEFEGWWVAVRKHEIVASGEDLRELLEEIERLEETERIEVEGIFQVSSGSFM